MACLYSKHAFVAYIIRSGLISRTPQVQSLEHLPFRMPTEQERPGMFARPQKAPSILQRGSAYDDSTTLCAASRNQAVGDATNSNVQHGELSQRRYLVPVPQRSRKVGTVVSTTGIKPQASVLSDASDRPHNHAEQHSHRVLGIKQQHAEPLHSHPTTSVHIGSQLPRHQNELKSLPLDPDDQNALDTIEGMISPAQRADSPLEVCSSQNMASSVELANWNIVNKGPVVLCPTPPPAMRGDELFFDTDLSSQEPGTWSHVQSHSPEVSDAGSLKQPLLADMIDWDEGVPEKRKASVETRKISEFHPLVLHLPHGPSLHEEIFGRPLDEDLKTCGSGEGVADNLEEYAKYTGWIERK